MGSLWFHSHKMTKISDAAEITLKPHDEVRLEPVFALSFVEDHLQRSEAERDQARVRCSRFLFRSACGA